jgi:hypothetical protein
VASRGFFGRFAVLVVVLVSAGALTGSANAQLLGGACGDRPLSRPFLPWLDPMQYTLAPRGNFESGTTGWTLKGGAAVVTGNEPWKVSGAGSRSLYLPSGSSAMTPPICVETLDPTVRYFAKNRGVVALSSLLVEVVLLNSSGQPVLTLPAGVHTGLGSWHPSLPGVGLLNATALLNGGKVNVKFRFRPVGLGAKWQIDDVYVDPLKMG